MKILFIIPSITNYFTFLEDLINNLIDNGYEVHLATSIRHISKIDCYKRDLRCILHEINFPRGFNFLEHYLASKKLNQLVLREKPDIIEVHFSAAIFTTVMAKNKRWPYTKGTIHGLGSPLMNGWKKFAIELAEKWSVKRIDQISVLNQSDLENLKSRNTITRIEKIDESGLGCNLELFDKNNISEKVKSDLKKSLNIKEDDFVFIFIGRQVNFKGFDKVVKAYLNLYKNYKNTKLILVGAKDNLHSNGLSKADELKMKNCKGIIQVGWCENVNEFLAISNLNIFPSEREGMPVNLMESIAMGIPVITTNTRGCNEVIKNNFNGIILVKNTVKQIERSMLELFIDSDKLNFLSKNAFKERGKFDRKLYINSQLNRIKSIDNINN